MYVFMDNWSAVWTQKLNNVFDWQIEITESKWKLFYVIICIFLSLRFASGLIHVAPQYTDVIRLYEEGELQSLFLYKHSKSWSSIANFLQNTSRIDSCLLIVHISFHYIHDIV